VFVPLEVSPRLNNVAAKFLAIRTRAHHMALTKDDIMAALARVTLPNGKELPDTDMIGPTPVAGVDRILAIGSGKGGVGKSTVSSNLAVALAKQGRRVGLLDADIYGPSQPRMMGVSKRPGSPDGKTIIPLQAHGVTMMSIGLMVDPNKAVVWRGPMLMGALQQMLGQVEWGELDVLIVDLPPGTGDVQLTLCQKTQLTGAVVVSTPQDVALIDARKALDMFNSLNTPVLGLIENMSTHSSAHCRLILIHVLQATAARQLPLATAQWQRRTRHWPSALSMAAWRNDPPCDSAGCRWHLVVVARSLSYRRHICR